MGIKDKLKEKEKDEAKKKLKKSLKRKLMMVIAGIMSFLIIISAFYAIIMTIEGALVELWSNVTTSISKFWKWIRDDYWIKLDEEMEFSYLDEDTRTN